MNRKVRYYNNKMSLVQKCRWSLRGKSYIGDLIRDLRKYNHDLVRLCDLEMQAQINRALPTFALPQCNNFLDLQFIADSAKDAAKDKSSPMTDGRERMAEMAKFKAKMVTPGRFAQRFQTRYRLLDQRDYDIKSRGPRALAISLHDQQVVFVEWQSYIDNTGRPNKLAEDQIHKLGHFLSISDRPHDFRVLDCVGMFKDQKNSRYGVVYYLPRYMRDLVRRTRPEDLGHICKPSSLAHLLDNINGILDLGIRFELAKRLMYSVVVLHTCGWLHKNIRSSNIFFFPARPADNKSFESHRKDIGHPYIMGYGLSRPDDVFEPTKDREVRLKPYSRVPGERVHVSREVEEVEVESRPSINIYQHPDKTANPTIRFRHSYDIYSMGLVLLEIGLWQNLQTFNPGERDDAFTFRRSVLKELVPDLWGQCGSIYGGVVKDCLTMSSDVRLEDEEGRRLAWSMAERLNLCNA